MAQLSDLGRVDGHRAFNAHYARCFALLAEEAHLLNGSIESLEDSCMLSLSTANADEIHVLAHAQKKR